MKAATLVVVGLAFVAVLLRPELGWTVTPVVMLLGYAVAGLHFVSKAGLFSGRERSAWTLIGAALLVGAAGVLLVVAFVLSGTQVEGYWYTDFVFLAAFLLVLAGTWMLPHLEGARHHRVRVILDGLIGSLSLSVVLWVWFLEDMLEQIAAGDFPLWQVAVGWAYPLLDLAALVTVMVVALRRSTYRFDLRLLLIGGGLTAQAIAELIYFRTALGASWEEAAAGNAGYVAAVFCFLAASFVLHRRPQPREYAERRTPLWALVAPYGAAVLLLGTLVVRMAREEVSGSTAQLFVASLLVGALVVARQVLAIRDNRELVERQRQALVSSISHELRTPLTAMVGFLDILVEPDQEMSPADRDEMTRIVHQQATYMARIVSDLVLLARQSARVELRPRRVEVSEVVHSALQALDVESSGVALEVEEGLSGFFDPDRIQQVLVNLLTNAIRYGGPQRMVRAYGEGHDLVIEVHDDGPGVPKKYELSIWERFERGSHRYNAGVPGSGIGLAVVDMLVKAHGGQASYQRSDLLGGACFRVVLPGTIRPATPVPV